MTLTSCFAILQESSLRKLAKIVHLQYAQENMLK